ncbi:MAG: DUF362 domain-containing protein [Candidatus Woesearchaeota archaeon]
MEVSFVRCRDYSNAESAVKEAVKKCGFSSNPKTVLIKPNILGPYPPERAITTHPKIIEAAIRLFPKSRIIVGESSGTKTNISLKVSGIRKAAEDMGAEVINFEGQGLKLVKLSNPYVPEVYLPKILFKSDLIVNIPKLKTHSLMKYTGAVKNLYGCIPGAAKMQIHSAADNASKLGEVLADLYSVIRPGLNIMDAVTAMDGFGPANGNKRECKIIIASKDAAALDMAVARMIGLEELLSTTHILKKGYFNGKFSIKGHFSPIKFSIPSINPVSGMSPWLLKLPKHTVEIDLGKCTGCETCIRHCPVKAISSSFSIDKDKCIQCFCCQELCPANAIRIKKNLWMRAYDLGQFLINHARIKLNRY